MARPKSKIVRKVSLPPNWIGAFFHHLYEAGSVDVPGFGTFSVIDIPRRITFHNFSGRNRVIPAYKRLKFTQSPALKKQLGKRA